jgi:hypothetical protein
LDLRPLQIKHPLLKNENRICFPGKEKEGIEKLSKKIQQEMDSYKKSQYQSFLMKKKLFIIQTWETLKLIQTMKVQKQQK